MGVILGLQRETGKADGNYFLGFTVYGSRASGGRLSKPLLDPHIVRPPICRVRKKSVLDNRPGEALKVCNVIVLWCSTRSFLGFCLDPLSTQAISGTRSKVGQTIANPPARCA